MTLLDSTVRRRELGRRLRAAQQHAGWDGRRLARLLGWTETRLSRMINGRGWVRDVDVASFLALCRVTGAARERIMHLCGPHADAGLLRLPVEERWSALLAHAADAVRVIEVQPTMLPWLVQTPDYTRALHPVAAEREVRRAAVALLRRPCVEVVIHEAVLRTLVGDAVLMADQLAHLLRIAAQPSLSVRVVPAGCGVLAAGYGPFTLLEFEYQRPVVYREDPGVGVFTDAQHEVAAYRAVLEHLNTIALTPKASNELIVQVIAECDSNQSRDDVADDLSPALA